MFGRRSQPVALLGSWFFIWFVSIQFLLIPSALLHAEEPKDAATVQQLEPVVVSATKTPVPISQLTSAVEVITGEEMKRRKLKTVVDALRFAQGAAVFSNGGPGTVATVQLRGFDSTGTLVLIDGTIVNSATTGSYDFANLTTDNIERIEILRGAQSMMWGADAIGGVINIVTKKGKGPITASAFSEYGSFLSLREGGQLAGKHGPMDLSITLSRWDFTGFSQLNYRRGATERDAYRNWQGSSRLGLELPHDGRFDFMIRWLNGVVDFDNPPQYDVFKAKSSSQQFIYSGIWDQPITTWWNQKLTLSRSQESLINQAGTLQKNILTGALSVPSSYNNSTINTLSNRIEWQHNIQITKELLFTGGYQFREQQGENISSSAFPSKIISSHAGFAEIQANVWKRINGTAGLRYDSYNVFGNATTYRVTGGYSHTETGTKIRGSYATGFRAPTINELFFPGFGNPNLTPEKSQSIDVGVDQYFFEHQGKLSVGYFWNRYRNLIQTIQSASVCGIGAFGSNFCPVNVGSAKSQGWEVGLNYSAPMNLAFLKSIDIHGQYTYTLTRDLNTGARLGRWPIHQASAIISIQSTDSMRVNVEFRYVGSRFSNAQNQNPLKSFMVFNLAADYAVTDWVNAYVRVENLFNEKYEEIQFYGTAIRSIYGGVKMSFELPEKSLS